MQISTSIKLINSRLSKHFLCQHTCLHIAQCKINKWFYCACDCLVFPFGCVLLVSTYLKCYTCLPHCNIFFDSQSAVVESLWILQMAGMKETSKSLLPLATWLSVTTLRKVVRIINLHKQFTPACSERRELF